MSADEFQLPESFFARPYQAGAEAFEPWDEEVETRDFGDDGMPGFHLRVGSDLRDLLTAPGRMRGRHWRRLGYGLLAVGAVSLLDDSIRDSVRAEPGSGSYRMAEMVRPLGQEGGLALIGLTWLSGRAFDKPQFQYLAQDAFEATFLSAGLITPALKSVVGRSRPREDVGNSSFGGAESFPSGEVTQIFTLAAVVSAHSHRRWVKGVAWGVAGSIAWQRMALDAHWASDVAAAAVIGSSVGYWVVRRNRRLRGEEPRWTVTPMVSQDVYGVGVRLAF